MPKKKKLIVDKETCIGCGTCVALCPDVFEIKEDGKSEVVNEGACEHCDCNAAIESCPTQSIQYVEEEEYK